MLVLSRKLNEKILIEGGIEIQIVKITANTVRLGIEAPKTTKINRKEKLDELNQTAESE